MALTLTTYARPERFTTAQTHDANQLARRPKACCWHLLQPVSGAIRGAR
jgi:hypothetical protein